MNKVTKFAAIAAVIAVAGMTRSYGMAEAWSAQNSRFATLQGGTAGVAQGSLVEIGLLSVSQSTMVSNQNNITFIDANFNEWATSTVGFSTGLDGAWSAVSASPGAGFFSQQIYLLVYNAATAGAATQVGIFTNPGWIFPSSDGAAQGGLDLGDVNTTAVIGALSSGTLVSPPELAGSDAASLHLVPEPSSIALAGLGLLGLVGFARRRRS